MKNKQIETKKISNKDSDLIEDLCKKAKIKSYLKNHKEIGEDFRSFSTKKTHAFTYWVCLSGDKPVGLIITSDLAKEPLEYMTPWVEQKGETLWVDLILLSEGESSAELGSECLKLFAASQPQTVEALLAEPEMKEDILLACYEQAGFSKGSSFIKGNGFFKGTAHFLMKYKI